MKACRQVAIDASSEVDEGMQIAPRFGSNPAAEGAAARGLGLFLVVVVATHEACLGVPVLAGHQDGGALCTDTQVA